MGHLEFETEVGRPCTRADTWVWSCGEGSELDVRHLEWHLPVDACLSAGTRQGHVGCACRESNELKDRTLDRRPF